MHCMSFSFFISELHNLTSCLRTRASWLKIDHNKGWLCTCGGIKKQVRIWDDWDLTFLEQKQKATRIWSDATITLVCDSRVPSSRLPSANWSAGSDAHHTILFPIISGFLDIKGRFFFIFYFLGVTVLYAYIMHCVTWVSLQCWL